LSGAAFGCSSSISLGVVISIIIISLAIIIITTTTTITQLICQLKCVELITKGIEWQITTARRENKSFDFT